MKQHEGICRAQDSGPHLKGHGHGQGSLVFYAPTYEKEGEALNVTLVRPSVRPSVLSCVHPSVRNLFLCNNFWKESSKWKKMFDVQLQLHQIQVRVKFGLDQPNFTWVTGLFMTKFHKKWWFPCNNFWKKHSNEKCFTCSCSFIKYRSRLNLVWINQISNELQAFITTIFH